MTTLTDLIPGLRGTGSHRAVDRVAELEALGAELRDENVLLHNRQAAADDFFGVLTHDRDEVYAAWRQEQQQRQEAELVGACITQERDELADENAALRKRLAPFLAAEANAHRITVPPMQRDTSALEDQATQPIPVLQLREAAAAGLLGPVLDPGQP